MKYSSSQFGFLFAAGETRTNLTALLKYFAFLIVMVTGYTVLFHLIMGRVEGQQHSWITGFYWTLVVMTTLGFGDITFTSDIGRLFSMVVLVSGVVFLLVMLPFLFIRLFYAPWLESRVRLRAPREVRAGTKGHVIITEYDAVAAGLVERLNAAGIPYFIVESDAGKAAGFVSDELSVVAGENDSRATYERLRTPAARMVVANCEDTVNTNITLTVREVAPDVHIAAVVEEDDSVDILQLSGATTVLPLKRQLGESLANRVDTGRAEAHVIGSFHGVQVAELPVRDTLLAGALVRDTRLRELTGLSVIGLWERGRLQPAFPHTEIRPDAVAVVAGLASADSRAQRADRSRGHDGAGAGDWRGKGRARRRKGAETQGADCLRARSRPEGARDPRARHRRDLCGRRLRPGDDRTGWHRSRRFGAADDQRRCHEYLSRRLLSQAQSRSPHREPHHARAQRRGDSPRRRRLRAQLHDAWS